MSVAGFLLPLARDYARHAGLDAPDDELHADMERRLALLPWWGRVHALLGGVFLRWAAPLLLQGRPRTFGGLGDADRERLLERLQGTRCLALKGLFFGVKAVLVSAVYGREGALPDIGYR